MNHVTKRVTSSWREVLAKPAGQRPLNLQQFARRINHFGSLVFRMPALPYVGGTEHCLLRTEHALKQVDVKEMFANERARLERLCTDPIVREAIYVASPSLYSKLVADGDAPSSLSLDIVFSVLRYVTRMSSRCAPFGLFAGVAVGRVSPKTALLHPKFEALLPHVRVDTSIIDEAVAWASKQISVRQSVKLRVNNTYCELNGYNARYVEHASSAGNNIYSLANVQPSPHLSACVAYAQDYSGRTAHELAQFITHFDNEICYDEAMEFVFGLVDAQLLIPAIAPTITSADPLGDLIDVPSVVAALPALREVHQSIQDINNRELGGHLLNNGVHSALSALPFKFVEGRTLYVDAQFPSANLSLSEATVQTIVDAIFPYHVVSYRKRSASLERFQMDFLTRFGSKEVPLAVALDSETGIIFHVHVPSVESPGASDAFLFKRVVESIKNLSTSEVKEILLTDDDIIAISATVPHTLPKTMSVLASLARGQDELDVSIKGVIAPCGAQLLGRFAFASSHVDQLVRDMIAVEEASDPQRIFAEIVHVPAGRIGNVIGRPAFRQYEIPYTSPSSKACKRSFPLSDLLISIKNDRIILRSASLGLEVLPRLSCAHNFAGDNLNTYQFLCALQHQGGGSFVFEWGHSFDLFDYLPRVKYRNCIFALARWRIDSTFVEGLKLAAKRGSEIAFAWLQKERVQREMPRIVQVEESDSALVFDLDNPLSVALLADFLEAKKHSYLVEGPRPDRCAVHDASDNGYMSEIVLPLYLERDSFVDKSEAEIHVDGVEKSILSGDVISPGGKVAYLKIYGGEKSLDNFVVHDLREIFRKLSSENLNLRMFYVRYYDSDYHLRIRFLMDNHKNLWSYIVPKLLEEIASSGEKYLLRDTQITSYEREDQRYGGRERMEICETIFSLDSALTLDVFDLLRTTYADASRWGYAVFVANFIVESAFCSLEDRHQLFEELFVAYSNRGIAPREMLKANLAEMYRTRHKLVDAMLFRMPAASSLESYLLVEKIDTLSTYRDVLRSLKLQFSHSGDRAILGSIVHMSMNRIFATEANKEEAVTYYLVLRALESHIARNKSN